jgi:hypothetical protein
MSHQRRNRPIGETTKSMSRPRNSINRISARRLRSQNVSLPGSVKDSLRDIDGALPSGFIA